MIRGRQTCPDGYPVRNDPINGVRLICAARFLAIVTTDKPVCTHQQRAIYRRSDAYLVYRAERAVLTIFTHSK
jgi:hypothetical protein